MAGWAAGGTIRGNNHKLLIYLAPQVGLEPTTLRLTAECSAIELLRSVQTGNFATVVDFTANSIARVKAWLLRS
jgi:hypothetical protein